MKSDGPERRSEIRHSTGEGAVNQGAVALYNYSTGRVFLSVKL